MRKIIMLIMVFAFISAAIAVEPAVAEKDNKTQLKIVVPCQFDSAVFFSEGLAPHKTKRQMGICRC